MLPRKTTRDFQHGGAAFRLGAIVDGDGGALSLYQQTWLGAREAVEHNAGVGQGRMSGDADDLTAGDPTLQTVLAADIRDGLFENSVYFGDRPTTQDSKSSLKNVPERPQDVAAQGIGFDPVWGGLDRRKRAVEIEKQRRPRDIKARRRLGGMPKARV